MAADQLIREQARAKINLYLHVTGKRDDGYHLLDSLVGFTNIGDTITAAPADALSLDYTGPFAGDLPPAEDNLVMRAAHELKRAHSIKDGATLVLEKQLPVASGIGGGSADAAAAIWALCRLWEIDPSGPSLQTIALSLGADIPGCLLSQTAIMRGIGEDLHPLQHFPTMAIVLVNPGLSVSTPEVFRARSAPFTKAFDWPDSNCPPEAAIKLIAQQSNDLEHPAIGIAPAIADVLSDISALPGARLARMSGSGATCFGLFAERATADEAANAMRARHPEWWVQAGEIGQIAP